MPTALAAILVAIDITVSKSTSKATKAASILSLKSRNDVNLTPASLASATSMPFATKALAQLKSVLKSPVTDAALAEAMTISDNGLSKSSKAL